MTKEYLLKESDKSEFYNFLLNDKNGEIVSLLDDEGVLYLSQYKYPDERLRYILTHSKYVDALFKNNSFLDLFFKYLDSCLYDLYALKDDTYDLILLNANDKLSIKEKVKLLNRFEKNYTLNYILKSLDNYKGSLEPLYILYLYTEYIEIKRKIINEFDLDLTKFESSLTGSSLYCFFSNAKELSFDKLGFSIPNHLITKSVAKQIVNKRDIFEIRKIINDAMYVTDTTFMDEYVKEYEDKIINNAVHVANIINEFKHDDRLLIDNKLLSYDELKGIMIDYSNNNYDVNSCISNYIIDYHFKENYYNIMRDLNELLNFYYDGNIFLEENRLEIYKKIIIIDDLSIEEKKELHEYLKKFNMVELFYDDMSYARYLVRQAIKDSSINKNELERYKDEKLSKEYGVSVYKMNGEPFFGIVKTDLKRKNKLPTGYSYSLIGTGGIGVFNASRRNTFLYDSQDLNPNQIVHVFPFDSYTSYNPFLSSNVSTSKVNVLLTPEELVYLSGKCNTYNEILILERGTNSTEMDNEIKKLKEIALFCVDKINEDDVKTAQKRNVGIILVPAKLYKKNDEYLESLYIHNLDSVNNQKYNYFKVSSDYYGGECSNPISEFVEERKNRKI